MTKTELEHLIDETVTGRNASRNKEILRAIHIEGLSRAEVLDRFCEGGHPIMSESGLSYVLRKFPTLKPTKKHRFT